MPDERTVLERIAGRLAKYMVLMEEAQTDLECGRSLHQVMKSSQMTTLRIENECTAIYSGEPERRIYAPHSMVNRCPRLRGGTGE